VAFALTAHPDRPRPGQLTLFGPAEVSPDRLATALAKLLALLGEGRVGAPAAVSGHRPERPPLLPLSPPPPPLPLPAPRDARRPARALARSRPRSRPARRPPTAAAAAARSALCRRPARSPRSRSPAPSASPPGRGVSRKNGGATPLWTEPTGTSSSKAAASIA